MEVFVLEGTEGKGWFIVGVYASYTLAEKSAKDKGLREGKYMITPFKIEGLDCRPLRGFESTSHFFDASELLAGPWVSTPVKETE